MNSKYYNDGFDNGFKEGVRLQTRTIIQWLRMKGYENIAHEILNSEDNIVATFKRTAE